MHPSNYLQLVDVRARMALRADASRYMLGYIWWILEPLLFVAVFYVVFSVVLDSRRADFLAFLMCGKLSFIWFSKSVSKASDSIVAARGLIGNLNAPKSLFPVAVVQEGLYKQVAVFVLLLGFLWSSGYAPSRFWLWLVPIILVNYLMIVACALMGSCLVCVVRDFSKAIPLVMTFLLFTSGIFWDVNALADGSKKDLILALNPLAFIIDAYRQVLMYHGPPDATHLLLLGVGAVIVIVAVLLVMRSFGQYLSLRVITG
jgi:lipopolysaccharide transport system permease protein